MGHAHLDMTMSKITRHICLEQGRATSEFGGAHQALARPRSQKARERTAERNPSTSSGCANHIAHRATSAAPSAASTFAPPNQPHRPLRPHFNPLRNPSSAS